MARHISTIICILLGRRITLFFIFLITGLNREFLDALHDLYVVVVTLASISSFSFPTVLLLLLRRQ